ncbi:MAG: putative toxin-antitoxin system toxin component, PIN family [Rhodothermales bacterium]
MTDSLRVVLDTNVPVSALLTPGGKPQRAVDLVARQGLLLFSEATYDELIEVLARPRLRKFLPAESAAGFAQRVVTVASRVVPNESIQACRDPRDDSFST